MAELGSGNGSDYPATLDTDNIIEVNTPAAGRTKARAEVVNDLAAAIVAVQNELGVNPAGALTDVVTFLQTEHNTSGVHKYAVVSKTANYTATAADNKILCAGTFTITLPTAVGIQGKDYQIINTAQGVITVDGDGTETINNSLTATLDSIWAFITVMSDNTNWIITNINGLVTV